MIKGSILCPVFKLGTTVQGLPPSPPWLQCQFSRVLPALLPAESAAARAGYRPHKSPITQQALLLAPAWPPNLYLLG